MAGSGADFGPAPPTEGRARGWFWTGFWRSAAVRSVTQPTEAGSGADVGSVLVAIWIRFLHRPLTKTYIGKLVLVGFGPVSRQS